MSDVDWVTSETISNPDGSVDVHYCDGCGFMLATETVEAADECPSCGYPEDDTDG